MSASLIELIMSIVLSSIVLLGTAAPAINAVLSWQQAELRLAALNARRDAAFLFSRTAGRVWRGDSAPDGTSGLLLTTNVEIDLADEALRCKGSEIQLRASGDFRPIADDVAGFQLSYLLSDGTWKTDALTDEERAAARALRYVFLDGSHVERFTAVAVFPDCVLADETLALPKPDTSTTYDRADYTVTGTLTIGAWQ